MNLRVVYFPLKHSCLYDHYCFSSYVTGHIACLKLKLTISSLKSPIIACVAIVFAGIFLRLERLVFLFFDTQKIGDYSRNFRKAKSYCENLFLQAELQKKPVETLPHRPAWLITSQEFLALDSQYLFVIRWRE